MRLTNQLQANGVLFISNLRNGSGSYQAEVTLDRIDRESNGTNFRKFSKTHATEINANFNKQAVRNPILIWTGQRLKSIDGRHTIATLQERGYKKWTADIFFKMSHEEAAAVFYELTMNSKRMGPWDGFSAALEANYQFAIEISNALGQYRMTTPNDPGYNSTRADFKGFTPLHDAYERGGRNFLNAFLRVLQTWKHGVRLHKDARLNPFQRGLVDYLSEELQNATPENIAQRLGRREAGYITEIAGDFAQKVDQTRAERVHFKEAFQHVGNLRYRAAA